MEEKIKVTDTYVIVTFETTPEILQEAEDLVNEQEQTMLNDFLAKLDVVSPLKGKYMWDKEFIRKVYGIDKVMFFTEKSVDYRSGAITYLLSYFPLPEAIETINERLGRN